MTDPHLPVDLIETSIREEISMFLRSRIRWRTIGICMETMSKIMLGSTSIITFATILHPCNTYLSFIAGTVSTLSLVSLQFSNYSFRESKLSTENLNILLSKMNMNSLPELNGSVLRDSPLHTIVYNHTPENKSNHMEEKDTEEKECNHKVETIHIKPDFIPQLHLPETPIISTQQLSQI